MIDTHAHVHDPAFDSDRSTAIDRARERGVETIVTVGCDLSDSGRARACAAEWGIYASAGIHPHEAKDAPADVGAALGPMLDDPHVVAVGETGLDYYYDRSPHDVQVRVLRDQIRLARERKLPLIFHHRDAFRDFATILEEEFADGMRGVVHCFTGDAEQARTYVERFKLKLGVGGVITFKHADTIRNAIAAVGIGACILETDCPYLAPVPHRGKRNEPSFVAETAAILAQVTGTTLGETDAITTENARVLFNLPI
ncbi:MAG: TatD family hydrolase [Candidatus Eremiobacteraeota bacterium]|nr:TatD family hydrolase [Candidatus Eremiobacteraeota bacterium]